MSLDAFDFYDSLSRGDVGAIVDERPYMESLVAKHCNRLAFAGQTFTIQNWGFVSDYYWDLYFDFRVPNIQGNDYS